MLLFSRYPFVLLLFSIWTKLQPSRADFEESTQQPSPDEEAAASECRERVTDAFELMDDMLGAVPPVELKENMPPGFDLIQGFGPELVAEAPQMMQSVLQLTRDNMEKIYNESKFWMQGSPEPGWNNELKWKELIDEEAFHIIVVNTTTMEDKSDTKGKHEDPEVVGVLHLRYLPGDEDVEDSCFVLYVYEIQLAKSVQGKGLGFRLMNYVKQIAMAAKVDAVQLTVQKGNPRAFKFYTTKCGFKIMDDYKETWQLEWKPECDDFHNGMCPKK